MGKPSQLPPDVILLQDYGLNLKQEVEAQSKHATDPLAAIDTMGALAPDDLRFVRNNCHLTIGRLGLLVESYLQVCFARIAQLQYLLTPIKQALDVEQLQDCEQLHVGNVLQVLLQGDFYRFLKDSLPKCIINNRTTSTNVEILVASLLLLSTNKLSMEEIKDAIVVFTLHEREHEIDGVFLEAGVIMNMLKHLNRTVSNQTLKQWIGRNTFRFDNFLMPWEFMYLACQCPIRDVYLRKICKLNFKNVKIPNSKLYLIQPAKEIAGTPDFKIQQQLAAIQAQEQPIPVKNQTLYKFPQPTNKTCKSVSKFKALLQQEGIYRDIKNCLAGKEKSENLKECLLEIQPRMSRMKRPFSSVVPFITDSTIYDRHSFCTKAERIKTMHTETDVTVTGSENKRRPATSMNYHRQVRPSTCTASKFADKKSCKLRSLYKRELSNFDLNKPTASNLTAFKLLL